MTGFSNWSAIRIHVSGFTTGVCVHGPKKDLNDAIFCQRKLASLSKCQRKRMVRLIGIAVESSCCCACPLVAQRIYTERLTAANSKRSEHDVADARNESTPRLDFLHRYIPKTRRQSQRIKDEADDDDG